MLNQEDNDIVTRVGRGTPMGDLMRQYWVPALPSSEFPGPDSPPVRMKLLGEYLVMFRDTNGDMGCFAESCPHRGASLVYGRNEDCGLRCAYHGWKYDVTGQCIDMPSEPEGSTFVSKVKARAYPARDVNHMVWIYMGPREVPPPFPEFDITTLPPENVAPPSVMMEEANWLQNLEGDIDSAHLDWLHSRLTEDSPATPGAFRGTWTVDKRPRLEVVPTDYGAYYSARRTHTDGREWHRINQFIFPFHTMISVDNGVSLRSFVPLDDQHAMLIFQTGCLDGPIAESKQLATGPDMFESVGGYIERTSEPHSYYMTKANRLNHYGRDFEVEKAQMFSGIPFVVNLQDRAMTELMMNANGERIYDRTHEHLGTTDAMVIVVRRQLARAAKAFRDSGKLPPNVDDVRFNHVRQCEVVLPPGADWIQETEELRSSDVGVAVRSDRSLFA